MQELDQVAFLDVLPNQALYVSRPVSDLFKVRQDVSVRPVV
jgi:hypothetical protein